MPRRSKPTELRLGLAEYDSAGRNIADARSLFMRAAIALEPRVRQSLDDTPLRLYHHLFDREASPRLSPEQLAPLARTLGFADEIMDEHQAGREELGEEYAPATDAAPRVRYPRIYWRDPSRNPEEGNELRRDRLARGLSLEEEAARPNMLPCERREMERGCKPNAGLTTMSGAEPLRRALRQWGGPWHLTADWCFDWALEQLQLHNWPPDAAASYALGATGIIPWATDPPELPKLAPYSPQLQTRASYLAAVQKPLQKALTDYCAKIEQEFEAAGFKRTPQKRARAGSPYQHFEWLAGYQVCGWSQRAMAEAIGIDRAAVLRAIHRLAKQIALTLRPAARNNRSWTSARIRAELKRRPT